MVEQRMGPFLRKSIMTGHGLPTSEQIVANIRPWGDLYTQGLKLTPAGFQKDFDIALGSQWAESDGWTQLPGTSNWTLSAFTSDFSRYIASTFFSPTVNGSTLTASEVGGVVIIGNPDSDVESEYYSNTTNYGNMYLDTSTNEPGGSVNKVTSSARSFGTITTSFIADGASWSRKSLAAPRTGADYHAVLLAGNDQITGTELRDEISSAAGDDDVIGGGGNDWLTGGFGRDILDGGDGDDQLSDASGVNTFYGGAGQDRFYVQQGASGLWVTRPKGTDSVWYERKIRKGGKKVKQYWIDNEYDVIADYSFTDRDGIFFKGGMQLYVGEDLPGGQAIFVDGTDNVVAFIENVSVEQFRANGLHGSW